MIYSVLRRTLREGVTFDEFREAWRPPAGATTADFTVLHARSLADDREILSIGTHDMTIDEFLAWSSTPEFAAVNDERHARIAPLIEEGGGLIGAYELIEGDHIAL